MRPSHDRDGGVRGCVTAACVAPTLTGRAVAQCQTPAPASDRVLRLPRRCVRKSFRLLPNACARCGLRRTHLALSLLPLHTSPIHEDLRELETERGQLSTSLVASSGSGLISGSAAQGRVMRHSCLWTWQRTAERLCLQAGFSGKGPLLPSCSLCNGLAGWKLLALYVLTLVWSACVWQSCLARLR